MSFAYGDHPPVLNEINFRAEPGTVTALVGPSYTVGNRTVNKTEYLAELSNSMDRLIALRSKLEGPWQICVKRLDADEDDFATLTHEGSNLSPDWHED